MAAETKGTAHIFGIASGTITNATVMGFDENKTFGVAAETKDENGIVIERRYDDRKKESSITLRIQSGYTIPSQGDELTYNSVAYEITSVTITEANEAHKTVVLNLLQSEGITY
jgi:hypothetical protein